MGGAMRDRSTQFSNTRRKMEHHMTNRKLG